MDPRAISAYLEQHAVSTSKPDARFSPLPGMAPSPTFGCHPIHFPLAGYQAFARGRLPLHPPGQKPPPPYQSFRRDLPHGCPPSPTPSFTPPLPTIVPQTLLLLPITLPLSYNGPPIALLIGAPQHPPPSFRGLGPVFAPQASTFPLPPVWSPQLILRPGSLRLRLVLLLLPRNMVS